MARRPTALREIPAPSPAPRRRAPQQALPAYRFVPGLNPHPFRHEGGHLYTDGGAPAEHPSPPLEPWTEDLRWLYALDLFDHRYLWEAHEAWEALWHQVPRHTPESALLQALIQAAAGLLKLHMGEIEAASRLLERAQLRLESAEEGLGPRPHGLNLPEFRAGLGFAIVGGPWPFL